MLKRVYIDNFRCLVNFELSVDWINLFLGGNGSGKSSVFDVLGKIQELVLGDRKVRDIFKSADRTRWQISPIQSFELEIAGNGGNYKYELAIEFNREKTLTRVDRECLFFDNLPLLKFQKGEVQLYRDDSSEGPSYPFDWSRSALASILPRNDNTKLTDFKNALARFIIVKIIPSLMADESSQEEARLSPGMENFVSWYRYLSEDQGKVRDLTNALKDILDGFEYFKFDKVSDRNRVLKLFFLGDSDRIGDNFPIGEKSYMGNTLYRFGEISDGQRVLIALYALIYCTRSEDYILCIDEPENFLALPEIQPWLTELYDLCSNREIQALLISHHPELINYLLASPVGYWFERSTNRPARVKAISNNNNDTGLPISELIARGWLHE